VLDVYRGRKIGVAVPAYNEEKYIAKTLEEMPDFVDRIYVVDDCSKDGTAKIVEDFMKKDRRIELIRHEKNLGVGGAIVSGWKKGLKEGMDILAIIHGDNQMDPKFLPALLDPIVDGKADLSKGTRFYKDYWKEMPKVRVFGSMILNILNKIASGYWNVNDPQNGFFAIYSRALKQIDPDRLYKGYAFENDVLIRSNVAGLRVANVPVRIRYHGSTSKLRISNFALKTSFFLLRGFLWRIWKKYLRRGNPIGFLYLFGFFLILAGVLNLIFGLDLLILLIGIVLFFIACLWESQKANTV
jgi:glycosyltransferase involved in cell wall biosynthesis